MANSLTHEDRVDMGVAFFGNLFPGRTISLPQAELHNRGKSNQSFTEGQTRFSIRPNSMKLEAWLNGRVAKSDRGVEIFYSPTPMSGTSGRKKEQALPNIVVHGDADLGLTPEVHKQLLAWGACLVRSGGVVIRPDGSRGFKYHVYLRITEEISPNEVERLNRGLRHLIQGDKFDVTSLLRIPGTRNHKYTGSPIVMVEKLATKTHTPAALAKMLPVPEGEVVVSGVELTGMKMPEIPKGFRFNDNSIPGYAKVRATVREWNGRFQAGTASRRYMAVPAIVKDCIAKGLSVDVAYAFAMHCEPLLDKQEEENGYSIQKDVAKTYYRETKTTQQVEKITREAPTPAVSKTPEAEDPSFAGQAVSIGSEFPFVVPNLEELLSGDYKPLEPSLVPCGSYALLYPGKSHGLSSDRGVGKTHTLIAMTREIMLAGGRVVYFDFEDSPDTLILGRMINEHGISEEMIRNQFLYIGGIAKSEDTIEPTDAIIQLAEQLKGWDLAVIDGVTASMADWSVDSEWNGGAMLDGSKATDYTWWYKRQVQPFLDQGIATLQIDHTTKNGSRVSGTIQKGAKLTGVEYELRAEKAGNLVMGGTGRLILSAAKDRIGRVLRHKRRHAKEPEEFQDVAVFTMTSDINGKVTRAVFLPVNDTAETTSHDEPRGPQITTTQQRVLDVLSEASGPMRKSEIHGKASMGKAIALAAVEELEKLGLVQVQSEGRAHMVSIVAGALSAPAPEEGAKILDFSQVKDRPNAGPRRECGRCGEMEHLIRPDEVGYQDGKRLCRSCASESIEAETEWSRDGAERARRIRESIEGGNSSRRPRRRS